MRISKIHARVLKIQPPVKAYMGANGGGKSLANHYGQYGYEGPQKPDKGRKGGSCNRTACQRPGAYWYNRGSMSWYCTNCAHMLNHANRHDEFCAQEPLCKLDEEAKEEFYKKLEGE